MLYWWSKYVLLGPLLRLLCRPTVEGVEHIPERGGAILASNHLAVADTFFLPLVVRRRITFLAKAEYFTQPGFIGRLKRVLHRRRPGADRPTSGRPPQAALDTAVRHPERGQVARHLPGGHPLARRPAVQGQDRRGPDGAGDRRAGHPGRDDRHRHGQPDRLQDVAPPQVHIRIGKPLDFSRFDGMAGDRFIERAMIDEIMYELMELSGQEYVDLYAASVKERAAAAGRAVCPTRRRADGATGAPGH